MPLLHTSPIAAARFIYRASSMIKSCTAPIALSCVSPARQYPPRVKNLNAAFSLRLQGASSTTGILLRAHSATVKGVGDISAISHAAYTSDIFVSPLSAITPLSLIDSAAFSASRLPEVTTTVCNLPWYADSHLVASTIALLPYLPPITATAGKPSSMPSLALALSLTAVSAETGKPVT